MIIVKVKEGESIERALKRYKRKADRIGVRRQVQSNMHYQKPSEERIEMKKKAINRQNYFANEHY